MPFKGDWTRQVRPVIFAEGAQVFEMLSNHATHSGFSTFTFKSIWSGTFGIRTGLTSTVLKKPVRSKRTLDNVNNYVTDSFGGGINFGYPIDENQLIVFVQKQVFHESAR